MTDDGDRIIVTPARDLTAVRGKYKDKLPSTDEMRAEERAVDERRARSA